jgi:amino acid transporter
MARNRVGVLGIVFFVVAVAAPLTVVVALYPVIIGSGNGIGIAGTFILVALVLTVFAVGYVAMSKHITNTGAFYAYITKGLGRPLGLGSASLAVFGYNAIQLGVTGGFGYYAAEFVHSHFGIAVPWWVFSAFSMAAAHGPRNVTNSKGNRTCQPTESSTCARHNRSTPTRWFTWCTPGLGCPSPTR